MENFSKRIVDAKIHALDDAIADVETQDRLQTIQNLKDKAEGDIKVLEAE